MKIQTPTSLSMPLYPANTTLWTLGDYVINEYDSKSADMLMRVVRVARNGTFETRYVDETMHHFYGGKTWTNKLDVLHDPARFGIALPASEGLDGGR